MDVVRLEARGRVALLTLNRPKVLNALDATTLEAIDARRREVAAGDFRALVLTGEGRAFAAGADIEAMRSHGPLEAGELTALGHRVFQGLEELPFPTIAAVNGFALGGGCELALACDWIYASSQARFGQPEVKLGLIPGFGGTSRLTRRVGAAWAKELVLGGDPIDAETAQRIGLVNRIFEPEALLDAALAAGESAAERGPLAVALAKQVIQAGQDADVRVAHSLEQAAFRAIAASEDRSEGIAAFLEKRDPEFRGR